MLARRRFWAASVVALSVAVAGIGCSNSSGTSAQAPTTTTPATTSPTTSPATSQPSQPGQPAQPGQPTQPTQPAQPTQPGSSPPPAGAVAHFTVITGNLAPSTTAVAGPGRNITFTIDAGAAHGLFAVEVTAPAPLMKIDIASGHMTMLDQHQAVAELNSLGSAVANIEVEGELQGRSLRAYRGLRIFANGAHNPAGDVLHLAGLFGAVVPAGQTTAGANGAIETTVRISSAVSAPLVIPATTDILYTDMATHSMQRISTSQARSLLNEGWIYVQAEGQAPATTPFVADRHVRLFRGMVPGIDHPPGQPGSPSPYQAMPGKVVGTAHINAANEITFTLDLTGGLGLRTVNCRLLPSAVVDHFSTAFANGLGPQQTLNVLNQGPASVDVEGAFDPHNQELAVSVGVAIYDQLFLSPSDQDVVGRISGNAAIANTGLLRFNLDLVGPTNPLVMTAVASSLTRIVEVDRTSGAFTDLSLSQAAALLNSNPHAVRVSALLDPATGELWATTGIKIFR